jgi:methionyl-tRNA synthetase
MKKFFITTAIDYANSRPHAGHAYEKVVSDITARFKRLTGYDVYFSTGTDEHSLNVAAKAKELGRDPKAFCDEMAVNFRELCRLYNISITDFIQTTEPRHEKSVTKLFGAIEKAGDIYKGHYEGWYCRSCEAFYTPAELTGDKMCPVHGIKADLIKEENYFIKLSRYTDKLQKMIESGEFKINPETRRNEILSMLKQGFRDISVSRSGTGWGIKLPGAPDQTVYVWFDALINYITVAGYAADDAMFGKMWPANLHVIGKDIIKFHCIIWPIMLMSAGLEMPREIYAHGFLLNKGEKMSKTTGNVVDPVEMAEKYGAEAIRYYFAAKVINGDDGEFNDEAIKLAFNTDLANDLGNLVSRSNNMVEKYCAGVAPELHTEAMDDKMKALEVLAKGLWSAYSAAMEKYDFSGALAQVFKLTGAANKLIEDEAPWNLQKAGKIMELENVLNLLLETIRLASLALSPVMPVTAVKIWEKLGLGYKMEVLNIENEMKYGFSWKGIKVSKGEALFPRIVEEKKEK